jgi:hypothetical protein
MSGEAMCRHCLGRGRHRHPKCPARAAVRPAPKKSPPKKRGRPPRPFFLEPPSPAQVVTRSAADAADAAYRLVANHPDQAGAFAEFLRRMRGPSVDEFLRRAVDAAVDAALAVLERTDEA